MTVQTHYTLLGVRPPPAPLSAADLKRAYHAALLQHHPDKSHAPTISIDAITAAYAVLSTPALRRAYDQTLPGSSSSSSSGSNSGVVQNIDLDAFTYHDESGEYSLACRCGEQRGFVLREEELEAAVEAGEVEVGCVGCSLWWRVGFRVAN